MKTLTILGPTASGKTDLALDLARRFHAAILSLDSLAVYRQIDIASAKPTLSERGDIPHFGIDLIDPDEPFSAATFVEEFRRARIFCEASGRPLIIVGGTGFYLKVLLEGLSELPPPDPAVLKAVRTHLRDLPAAYAFLRRHDPDYAERIAPTDRYRIEKGLTILLQTGRTPTRHFAEHPPRPVLADTLLLEIARPKALLWERIARRTRQMVQAGLFDEVAELEYRYGRAPAPMKAIGLKEPLAYFDGKTDRRETIERIAIHTRQLAKRQKTFAATQLPVHACLPVEALAERAAAYLA
jgi:tRNA dimethylallyltransferase